ncbi:MAG: dTDP-4-dehydrorhamnose 3,5-epimerase family protein [Methanotrichaceae archaeon]|nr:dTDP-4-dehydrorhamnose 3,5-epimerase family protein [Methanotrichaceae archaeon]
MLPGIVVHPLKRIYDERGSFTEVMRRDWMDVFPEEIMQSNMSISYPGIVRAWHKHEKGQVDCFFVIGGSLKICAYDDVSGEFDEIVSVVEWPQIVRIPGQYWHGFKVIGGEPVTLVYFTNRLYDHKEPDEVRNPWDDPTIIPKSINGNPRDARCGKPWDWFGSPHK